MASWRNFQDALARMPENDPATTLTREKFLLPLFEELKFGRLPKKSSAFEVDGRSYAISHEYHYSPIHMLGCRISLEERVAGLAGAAKSSPHGLVQDLLNRSEQHLWGFVTNGLVLRILRDHHSLTQQAYVEFDLQAMLDGEHYSDFVLLWLLCHQSRIEADRPKECWLERWMEAAREEGISALDKLRVGVEQAIAALGTGFLKHPRNVALKADLHSGDLDKQEYFRELRNLVYRCIFLFVAEDRGVLLDPHATAEARNRYERFYSTRKLRTLSDRRRGGPHGDLWQGMRLVMDKLYEGCPELGLPALGSFLWSPNAAPNLRRAECANEYLLAAMRALCFFTRGNLRFLVNWRQVGADELGSIFESLLELHPRLNQEAGTFELDTAAGHERKTTGSYYTPSSLVDCLLDSALDPVVDAAVSRKSREEAERALLNLKVCDPACGSGHFLVAAARRIAKRLAAVRTGDDEPSPTALQHALRDVVGHCIFGVDVNKMAVELCRVALWMEAIEPGRPLSFLDNHIQHGNSLLGTTPALLKKGIPDKAFEPIEGDDKEVSKRLKKRNRDFRKKGQTSLESLLTPTANPYTKLTAEALAVEEDPDDALPAVRKKESDWHRFTSSQAYQDAQLLCDLWCAAFVWPKQPSELESNAPTEELWLRATQNPQSIPAVTKREVRQIAQQYQFFHWHLAFPQVFRQTGEDDSEDAKGWSGGFDVVLGNPPWERLKLSEQEFFAGKCDAIENATNSKQRQALIAQLSTTDPALFQSWKAAVRQANGESAFLLNADHYIHCNCGDLNTYALFAELNLGLLNRRAYLGCILPTGIATDETYKNFFGALVDKNAIVSLYDFENKGLFAGVHNSIKFSLLTLAKNNGQTLGQYMFFGHSVNDIAMPGRVYRLSSSDIQMINPGTKTCPTFRCQRDADITKAAHRRYNVMLSHCDQQEWNLNIFQKMFDTTIHASMIHFSSTMPSTDWVPVYEGKLIKNFNHRAATFADVPHHQCDAGNPRTTTEEELSHSCFQVTPRYWVHHSSFEKRMNGRGWDHKWFISLRYKARPADERTMIATIRPFYPSVNTLVSAFIQGTTDKKSFYAVSLSTFIVDYLARQKIGGSTVGEYIVQQLPIPSIQQMSKLGPWPWSASFITWIKPYALELYYNDWDLESYAKDCGYDGPPFRWDEARRSLLRCEVDAAFFHLYSIPREDVDYIMETFLVVRKRDIAVHGSYRTKDQILDIYDRMQRAIDSGEPYQTLLDPPPSDPQVAHPPRQSKD